MSAIKKAPVFLTKREQARYRRRGLAEAKAAIKAVSCERKPGRVDMRDAEERLTDLLCSLRAWAEDNEVSFHEVIRASEEHHMIETGHLAENYRDV